MTDIRISDQSDFAKIYRVYFSKMVRFACEYVISQEDAQNIVQDIFLYLWEHPDTWKAISNLNGFLFTLTKNRCIDFYRRKSRTEHLNKSLDTLENREMHLKMEALIAFDENIFSTQDVEEILDNAVNQLPERCREVFILSRMEGMKYEEIALHLNISVHTVQNHITSALQKLRVQLKDYLPLLIFFLNQ